MRGTIADLNGYSLEDMHEYLFDDLHQELEEHFLYATTESYRNPYHPIYGKFSQLEKKRLSNNWNSQSSEKLRVNINYRRVRQEFLQRRRIIKMADQTERFGIRVENIFNPSQSILKLYNWRRPPTKSGLPRSITSQSKFVWGPKMLACARFYSLLTKGDKLPKNYWYTPPRQLRRFYRHRQQHRHLTYQLNREFLDKLETSYYYDCRNDMQRIDSFYLKDEKNNDEYRFNYRDLNQPKPGDNYIWSLTKPLNRAICPLPDNYYRQEKAKLKFSYSPELHYQDFLNKFLRKEIPVKTRVEDYLLRKTLAAINAHHQWNSQSSQERSDRMTQQTIEKYLVDQKQPSSRKMINIAKSVERYRQIVSHRRLKERIDF